MTSFLREITGKSNRNQEISYAKIARCRPLGDYTGVDPPVLEKEWKTGRDSLWKGKIFEKKIAEGMEWI